jgi:pimeloyl-ACP methyl ester carboxylesterase
MISGNPSATPSGLCGDIPGAELSILANAGHFLPEDAPDALTAEILAFLPNAS